MNGKGGPQPYRNLRRIVKALGWLRSYMTTFEVVNNGKLNGVFEQMFAV